jgi:polyhydroxyalkanoate synthesis regulator phasin
LKKEILKVINENFIDMLLDMVNQNIQEILKRFQDNKNKECEKTHTHKINEIIGTLNKHQRETENTINREINELRMKIDNIKEEVTHDMKNLRKRMKQKYKTKCKATPTD